MTGKKLYDKLTSLRDFSGSAQDEYAQLLETIVFAISDDIYPLLEKAEKQNKKLSIVGEDTEDFAPELTIENIILV